ncbi:ABC transporter ATP-binding protein [Paracandidimonas soli]|uniref:Iron complex transport system ATP-binding protein n=2 Tax=Paracandidimonas soli TaxID=1917182 RepID=A0A4R3UW72_9BURK|nr:ABC transporter ATP-binding protein [Paracandidimonas soli]TCU95250.1 iron complex transport system ATP-binding protein [Paracandidimonas soli]
MSPPGLSARNIGFSYRGRLVLSDASLSLSAGELVCLLGVNGAGKSTLLKIMLGLLAPDTGVVALDGAPFSGWRRRDVARRVAYVPQAHMASFPYTVMQVAMMGRLPNRGFMKAPGRADIECVRHMLARLGIASLSERAYTEISGGERQLTLIARALAQEARLLVMDEPLSGLDYGNQVRLLARLEALVEDGYGVLMTTHDPNQPLSGCQRVAMLAGGKVSADGRPDEVLTPDAIEGLYGVRVDLLRTAEGKGIAFRPMFPQ